MQSMRSLYWPFLAATILFIGFVDTHTDEDGIILGTVLILSGLLGMLFPRRFVFTWLIAGCVLFVTETLVRYGLLHAPWPSSPGFSWAPLVALVPALLGAGAGVGIRRLAAGSPSV
jgi:hypothetical protein